jgi:hypothetical protein
MAGTVVQAAVAETLVEQVESLTQQLHQHKEIAEQLVK